MGPGDLVDGRYLVLGEGGRGGMAVVYRATDTTCGETVALKRLDLAGEPHARRFSREIEALAGLTHPAIVRYIGHGMAGEHPYLAMEWLDGETLSARLRTGPLPVEAAVALARRVASGLEAAHRNGLVHRDIKPSNLLLPHSDPTLTKVLDFGIARTLGPAMALTRTGMIVGTPAYMAPEQARGARDIDARADVFALGAVLFEAIAGRRPFVGANATAVLGKVLFEAAPRVRDLRPEVPVTLDNLIARMLSREPRARPADGGIVAALLESAVDADAAPIDVDATPDDRPRHVVARGLSDSERRVHCVVLTGAAGPDGALPTVTSGSVHPAELVRSAAARAGASVEVLVDGTAMALLSGDTLPAELAQRGARCALALRALLPEQPIVIATGVGVVAAGRAPVGEVIDRAVATRSTAPRSGIALDDVTAGLLDLRFDVRPGANGPILIAERDAVSVGRTLLGRAHGFVGRAGELAILRAVLDSCIDEPATRAAWVMAPAGAGKSRLADELLNRAREDKQDLEIWIARGDPVAARNTFGVLSDLVRRQAGIRAGDSLRRQRHRLVQRMIRALGDTEAAHRVARVLGEMCGTPFVAPDDVLLTAARADPLALNEQLAWALGAWLRAECALRPVVLILEDLHWADAPTLRLITGALRRLEDSPLMLLGLTRPEARRRFPWLWELPDATELRLGRLSTRDARRLVRFGLGDDADAERVGRLVARGEGNPLYLEELVRAQRAGSAESTLPETILGAVQARLASLSAAARRVLRAASVFGNACFEQGISALLQAASTTPNAIGNAFDELRRAEVLGQTPRAFESDRPEWTFHHALIRDAAYATLTADDRRLGHALAAQWLEDSGRGDALALAEHHERGGQPERAVRWYVAAATEATTGDDSPTAIERADRGLACGAEGRERGRLLGQKSAAYGKTGLIEQARECAAEAQTLLEPGTIDWMKTVGRLTLSEGQLGRTDEMRRWVHLLAEHTPGAGLTSPADLAVAIEELSRAASAVLMRGWFEEADELLERAAGLVASSAEVVPPMTLARHELARANRAACVGDLRAGLASIERARVGYVAAGSRYGECLAALVAADLQVALGRYAEATRTLDQAQSIAQEVGSRYISIGIGLTGALARLGLGALDEARSDAEQALQGGVETGNRILESSARGTLARVLVACGEPEGAERSIAPALDAEGGAPTDRAHLLGVLASALLGLGDPAGAWTAASEGMAILDAAGSLRYGEPGLRLAALEAALAIGDNAAAGTIAAAAHTRLRTQAAALDDSDADVFLAAVAENRRLLEHAARLSRPDPVL